MESSVADGVLIGPLAVESDDAEGYELTPSILITLWSAICSAGSWTSGPPMQVGRAKHSATLLSDGRILIVDGYTTPASQWGSYEVFQPDAGTFGDLQSPNLPGFGRYGHTINLLQDGRVLMAGGFTGTDASASCYLYDPNLDTWTATGSLLAARTDHVSFLLADGRVLVAGGSTNAAFLASAEIYNPTTGTWSSAGQLSFARSKPIGGTLASGKLIVAGGVAGAGETTNVDLYDPTAGTWTAAAPMMQSRQWAAGVLLTDGRFLVAGGQSNNLPVCESEAYGEAANHWSQISPLATCRAYFTMTLLADGTVLVTGGFSSVPESSVERFDPVLNQWSAAPPMSQPRYFHNALSWNGGVWCLSGEQAGHTETVSTETFSVPSAADGGGQDAGAPTQDGGTPGDAGTRTFRVGCDCETSSVPGAAAFALISVLLARKRR